ncbi:MAG: hypothetical protein MHMPM18_004335, partial [Marteilia pararefringens]
KSEDVNQQLFEFGRHLFLSLALMEIFRIFHFSDVTFSPLISLNLLAWYKNYGNNGNEVLLTSDSDEENCMRMLISSFLTFDLRCSKRFLDKIKLKQYLDSDTLEKLQTAVESCPIDINTLDSEEFDKDSIQIYKEWKLQCYSLYKTEKHTEIKLLLQILSGNGSINTFEELEDYLNIKDEYKLFFLERFHNDIEMSLDDFHENAQVFFPTDLDDLLNYEKSIVYLFKGNSLLFFTHMVKSLNIWWLPMHLIHIYFAYQELSEDVSAIFESIVIKHLDSVLKRSECSWEVVMMFTKELLPNNKAFLENILEFATVNSVDDAQIVMNEVRMNDFNSSYFENIICQKLLKNYKFKEFSNFLCTASDPVPCLMNLIKVISNAFAEHHDMRGFEEIENHQNLAETSYLIESINRIGAAVNLLGQGDSNGSMVLLLEEERPLFCLNEIYQLIIDSALKTEEVSEKTRNNLAAKFLPYVCRYDLPFQVSDLI